MRFFPFPFFRLRVVCSIHSEWHLTLSMSYIAFYRSSTSVLLIVRDLIESDAGAAAVVGISPGLGVAVVHSLVSHHSCSLVHGFSAALALSMVRFFFFCISPVSTACSMHDTHECNIRQQND